MRSVAVLGVGQTHIDEHWDKSLREIGREAIFAAMQDADIDKVDGLIVGNMLSPIIDGQNHLGALMADWSGFWGHEAVKVEAACASGAAAFRLGLMAVASGEIETALALGVEKMTDKGGHDIIAALATALDADYEIEQGASSAGLTALLMQRYMYEFGWKHADFAPFSVNAHANAMYNPFARLHEKITADEFEKSKMVSSPINMLDASPIGDGAAAAIIVPADRVASRRNRPRIIVGASSATTDTIAMHSRKDPLFLEAVFKSAKQCYEMANIRPENIDVFEAHDAFTIITALSLEACGFAERGKGVQFALDGEIMPKGRLPISTRGGLKARGHPVGATGIYQIVEIVQQLRGVCEETQIDGATVGMAQSIGGSASTVVTHILRID